MIIVEDELRLLIKKAYDDQERVLATIGSTNGQIREATIPIVLLSEALAAASELSGTDDMETAISDNEAKRNSGFAAITLAIPNPGKPCRWVVELRILGKRDKWAVIHEVGKASGGDVTLNLDMTREYREHYWVDGVQVKIPFTISSIGEVELFGSLEEAG